MYWDTHGRGSASRFGPGTTCKRPILGRRTILGRFLGPRAADSRPAPGQIGGRAARTYGPLRAAFPGIALRACRCCVACG